MIFDPSGKVIDLGKQYEYVDTYTKIEYIYSKLNMNHKVKYGTFHKCIFHLHTPASYDYKFLDKEIGEYLNYNKISTKFLYELCINKRLFPPHIILDDINYDTKLFTSKKEFLSYFLIANELILNHVEMVVVTDHNSIDGIKKLEKAINDISKFKPYLYYPEVIMGIEINCADKNHIVGIFDSKNNKIASILNEWLNDNIISESDGTYLTSIDVLKFINDNNGIGYIAHIDTTDIFKEKYLSGAYKTKLFSLSFLNVIGLSNPDNKNYISNKLKQYRQEGYCFIIDEDSHSIDTICSNPIWIKGSKSTFTSIRNAFRDYNISFELSYPETPSSFIKGLWIYSGEQGFLKGKSDNEFCVTFSDSLNCFIGGRGTGKSTVLHIIDFVLRQHFYSKDLLELMCNHVEISILYSHHNKDYLITFYSPQKEYADENIIEYFKDIKKRIFYTNNTSYNELEISDYTLKNYIHINCIEGEPGNLQITKVNNKAEYLEMFFHNRYSINSLVQIASDISISRYIYAIMLKAKLAQCNYKFKNTYRINELKKVISDINEAISNRIIIIIDIIDNYNKSQEGILKITYIQNKYFEELIDFGRLLKINDDELDSLFHSFNIKNRNVVNLLDRLTSKIGLVQLLELIFNNDADSLKLLEDIQIFCEPAAKSLIEKNVTFINDKSINNFFLILINTIVDKSNINSILISLQNYYDRCDSFDLLFNINNKENSSNLTPLYRSVRQLSLGQKVVAMLTFILGYSEFSGDYSPLIIDQPEDNLDNQYIYKNLVKQLREIKKKRQVIIATHNATLVTNAKAEQVIVMESDNKHGWIEKTGYPNDQAIIERIINYLEGGIESFVHKSFIYENVIRHK